ncbi:MAG: 3-isopropylmalate dehydratase small subunit [Porticoccaceae bacterium]|mgnify:FL=1|nr:3-isopropylmalate dehydratase small subunit [Porticoccaceae bacterium]MBT3799215.1 3-isopropylmalate dehydratase small subunit [Porticoccaceae bacterium]MBT4163814.1 3-isopropylmalate dehydratase small subunit [Porticoccaceae bacterium]MBT4211695.1 3-isopropylmalate dehydratase small subunit [Porticoccaceae bacterium]MBT4592547.1 3-isopropylmalate dehydratase small subunit [Porticoccaceae bacterium]
MKKFNTHLGIAAPLLKINIDTDAIMPSREMKTVSKMGLGKSLFANWRFLDRGTDKEKLNPEFILNQEEYLSATVLLAGRNMGCGSSREFAVWALVDYGIRAIIAPSFGAIFFTNCIRNGLLPIVLDEKTITVLADQVASNPQGSPLNIDLEGCHVTGPDGGIYPFELPAGDRVMLLEGLDAIDVTMKLNDAINAFKTTDHSKRPWAYLR